MLPVAAFIEYAKNNDLFVSDDRILLAVSGGKDSVLMCHLFAAAKLNFAIVHCNFNLRGNEAKRDEDFVKTLAGQLHADFFLLNFDTKAYADAHKMSIQMAARALRYAGFEEIRAKHHFNKIAIAQHQNDVIETVLFNLTRGTGIEGLHGILSKRGYIIRPLLFLKRQEIDAVFEEEGLSFVEDDSNNSTKYARNLIRLEVIPQLKKINPQLEETFKKNVAYFNELEDLLHETVAKIKAEIFEPYGDAYRIHIAHINQLKPKALLCFELFKPFGFNATTVNDLLKSLQNNPGKLFFSATHQLLLDRGTIILSKLENRLLAPVFLDRDEQSIVFGKFEISQNHQHLVNTAENHQRKLYINTQNLVYPLCVRSWQKGDFFYPDGMKGKKKISDYFIEKKIPLSEKAEIPLLFNGDGALIWVCGYRADKRFTADFYNEKVTIFEINNSK